MRTVSLVVSTTNIKRSIRGRVWSEDGADILGQRGSNKFTGNFPITPRNISPTVSSALWP